LKSSVEKLPRKIVVLLDEVDRMEHDELIALLKYIRGIDDLPGITFVCALNMASVAEQVRRVGFNSRNYLEKFFPIQISLPTIDSEILSSLFDARFQELCKKVPALDSASAKEQIEERFTPLWRKHIWKYLSNLRKLDLVFASLAAAFEAISAEVNQCDLLILEILRYISPEAYEFASLNRGYLAYSEWSWSHYDLVHINDDERQKDRNNLLQGFKEHHPFLDSASLPILEDLFPVLAGAKNAFKLPRQDQAEARRMKRIFHPSFTGIYFNRLPPPSRLSAAKQQEILGLLSGGDHDVAIRKFGEELEALSSSQMRVDLLDALTEAVSNLSVDRAIEVTKFLYSRSLEYTGFAVLGPTEWNLTRKIVFSVAAKFEAEHNSGQGLLIDAIANSKNAAFAAEVLFYSLSGNRRAEVLYGVPTSDEILKGQFASRFSREFIEKRSTNLMSMSMAEAFQILYRLVSCGAAAKELAEQYLRETFSASPALTAKFLAWTKETDTNELWAYVDRFVAESKLCKIVGTHLGPGVPLQDSDRSILNDYLLTRCTNSQESLTRSLA
jgi:KAP-like P-loop domain-containing protein